MYATPGLQLHAKPPGPIIYSNPLIDLARYICNTLLPRHPVMAPLPYRAPPSRPLPAAQAGFTALMLASVNGQQLCVTALIAAGADCNAKGKVRCSRSKAHARLLWHALLWQTLD